MLLLLLGIVAVVATLFVVVILVWFVGFCTKLLLPLALYLHNKQPNNRSNTLCSMKTNVVACLSLQATSLQTIAGTFTLLLVVR